MQVNDKIRQQLNTWADPLTPFIESEQWDNIFNYLKMLSKEGKTVIPKSADLFKSLQLCNRNTIKAVIIMQCPYATLREKTIVASGIPMSCENIAPYQQPSLHMWWQGIEATYGFHPDNDNRCDLSYLLEEESVLLMNSAWSVEMGKIDSHSSLWEPFTRYLIEEVIGKIMCGLPIVLVGSNAQRFEKYINPMCHHVLKVEHPAAAAHQNRDWKYVDMFNWINNILKASNGVENEIQWLRKKGEGKKVKETYPDWVVTTNPELLPDDLPF